ncbi:Crp/Fnr family transcriptional regulator [Sporosarcina soli]|uniref:Crp/Fnr family transcriptional regulator n=1 Tax=Sporosarcina soli TaxID=334736 RepID=A0ABW0TK96_9BACL
MAQLNVKEARRIFVKKNTVIYEQGQKGDGFYLLFDGKIKISMKVFDERERILEIQDCGQIFGEHSMGKKTYINSAVALENSVIYSFTDRQFQDLVMGDEAIRSLFYNSMIDKLKLLGGIIQHKSLSVEEQLANSLLEISRKYNSCEIPLNQQQLSNYTGLTRITVYKIMKIWMEKKLISKTKGGFFIQCRETLQKYVSAL